MSINYCRDIWLNSITPFNSLTPCQVKLELIYVQIIKDKPFLIILILLFFAAPFPFTIFA